MRCLAHVEFIVHVVRRAQGQKGPALALCTQYQRSGACLDGGCRFAHGEEELLRRERAARKALQQQQQQCSSAGGPPAAAAAPPQGFSYASAPAQRKLSPKVIEAMKTCASARLPCALPLPD
jgi:hypothetical protein